MKSTRSTVFVLLLCVFAFAAFGQTSVAPATSQSPAAVVAPVAPATGTFVPQYYVGTGISYDYYGKTGFAATSSFGILTSSSVPLYSFTTLELTSQTATVRTGAAYLFKQAGNFNLVALGDAGLATGSGPTLGSFSGGGFLLYDVGSRLTKGVQHFYVGGGGKVLALTGGAAGGVNPVFELTFGKGF